MSLHLQICGMVFADSEAVSEHMKLDHSDEEIEVNNYISLVFFLCF